MLSYNLTLTYLLFRPVLASEDPRFQLRLQPGPSRISRGLHGALEAPEKEVDPDDFFRNSHSIVVLYLLAHRQRFRLMYSSRGVEKATDGMMLLLPPLLLLDEKGEGLPGVPFCFSSAAPSTPEQPARSAAAAASAKLARMVVTAAGVSEFRELKVLYAAAKRLKPAGGRRRSCWC